MSYKDEDSTYWLKLFVIALIFALIIRKFVFSAIIVVGPSMQPTLFDSDQMIVNKFIYHIRQTDRLDIVILHDINDKEFIICDIRLPREHVQVKDKQLYIEYEKVSQTFLDPDTESEVTYSIITNDFTLE